MIASQPITIPAPVTPTGLLAWADGLSYDDLAEQEECAAASADRHEKLAALLKAEANKLVATLMALAEGRVTPSEDPRHVAREAVRAYQQALRDWDRANPQVR